MVRFIFFLIFMLFIINPQTVSIAFIIWKWEKTAHGFTCLFMLHDMSQLTECSNEIKITTCCVMVMLHAVRHGCWLETLLKSDECTTFSWVERGTCTHTYLSFSCSWSDVSIHIPDVYSSCPYLLECSMDEIASPLITSVITAVTAHTVPVYSYNSSSSSR